jgi:hypothetical protein
MVEGNIETEKGLERPIVVSNDIEVSFREKLKVPPTSVIGVEPTEIFFLTPENWLEQLGIARNIQSLIGEAAEVDLEQLPEGLRGMIENPNWIVNLSTRSRLAQFGLEFWVGNKGNFWICNHSHYEVQIPEGSYPLFRYWLILPWHLPYLRINNLSINKIIIPQPKRNGPVSIQEILATPREEVLSNFYNLNSPQKFKPYLHDSGELVLAITQVQVNVPPNETWVLFASMNTPAQNRREANEIPHSNSRIVDPGFSGKIVLELPFPPYLMTVAPTEIYCYRF